MGTVNENVRDDLIEHDISVRKVIGDEQRKVAARLRQLERDVIAELERMPSATELQQKRFREKVKQLALETYRAQNKDFKRSLRMVARAENNAQNSAIESAIEAP